MFYVPVNSKGHAEALPPIYGTFHVFHECNHPTKPISLICMNGLSRPLFLGSLRLERLTSNQMVGQ